MTLAVRRPPAWWGALACALFVVTGASSPAGSPVPPPLQSDTGITAYAVDGVNVIHKRAPASDVVSVNLYLLGGTRQVTPMTAGIEPLLLEASAYGTRAYSRDVLRKKLNSLGTEIAVDPDVDWTMFGFGATESTFDSTWAIFADRLMAPTLDSSSVELVRSQLLSAVQQHGDDPDALLEGLADSIAFAGHSYGIDPLGNERSLASLTRSDLVRYRTEQMVTSRMLLVVVGNIGRTQVESRIRATIGRLPKGAYTWQLPKAPERQARDIVVVNRRLPTNYILGYFAGPAANDPDYQRLRIASSVLSGRLFTEIRSRRNLSYAVHSPFLERAISAGGIYVTTVLPDSTLTLIAGEVRNLQDELIDHDALDRLIQGFITEYFLDNETNGAQADFLARAQLYRGDYRTAARFIEELREVTPEDIRRVARLYMHDMRFAYVGDPARISRSIIQLF